MSGQLEAEIDSIVGKVRGAFVPADEYSAWLEAHPNDCVISTVPWVFAVYQKLPES